MESDEKTSKKQLRKTVARQQEIIYRLSGENAQLRFKIATLETKLEKVLFYIEELQKIVFRRKKPMR